MTITSATRSLKCKTKLTSSTWWTSSWRHTLTQQVTRKTGCITAASTWITRTCTLTHHQWWITFSNAQASPSWTKFGESGEMLSLLLPIATSSMTRGTTVTASVESDTCLAMGSSDLAWERPQDIMNSAGRSETLSRSSQNLVVSFSVSSDWPQSVSTRTKHSPWTSRS